MGLAQSREGRRLRRREKRKMIEELGWSDTPGPMEHDRQLWEASYRNDAATIRRLAPTGVDIDQRDRMGRTPLVLAASLGSRLEAIQALIVEGCNVNARSSSGHTALHAVCERSDYEACEALLAAGAVPGIPGPYGMTPEEIARSSGKTEFADWLAAQKRRRGWREGLARKRTAQALSELVSRGRALFRSASKHESRDSAPEVPFTSTFSRTRGNLCHEEERERQERAKSMLLTARRAQWERSERRSSG
jgi:hypothetical protein